MSATPVGAPTFVMLGAAEAAACEGDACLVPGPHPDGSDRRGGRLRSAR